MELEHLISCEAPQSTILSSVAWTDVPSLRAFLEILLGSDSEYDSDDVDYGAPPRMCYHINGEVLPKEAPKLMPRELPSGEGRLPTGLVGGLGVH